MLDKLWGGLISNLGTKIISLIVAIVLWVVVLGSRNVEVTKEIPLEIITPADVVPANEIPEKIAFRLAGPKAFLRAILDRRDEPIRVNLSGAKPGLVTYRFFSDNIRVPIGVKVLSINPTAILIKLEYVKRRDVPVHLDLRGTLPDGLRLSGSEVRPTTVRIKGAESRVEGVTEVSTMPVDLATVHEHVDREVSLDIARLAVQLDGALPRMILNVQGEAGAGAENFRIRNVDIRVMTSYKFNVDEQTATVMVRAAPEDLKALNRNQVYAWVDLRGRPKGNYQEAVHVTLPDSVELVKVIPAKVGVKLY